MLTHTHSHTHMRDRRGQTTRAICGHSYVCIPLRRGYIYGSRIDNRVGIRRGIGGEGVTCESFICFGFQRAWQSANLKATVHRHRPQSPAFPPPESHSRVERPRTTPVGGGGGDTDTEKLAAVGKQVASARQRVSGQLYLLVQWRPRMHVDTYPSATAGGSVRDSRRTALRCY